MFLQFNRVEVYSRKLSLFIPYTDYVSVRFQLLTAGILQGFVAGNELELRMIGHVSIGVRNSYFALLRRVP